MKKSILVMSLLSGTAFCLTDITIASGNLIHTHTNTPELKPISQNYIKLASICFLGTDNCGSIGFGKGDENMNVDTASQCKNEGFTITSCSLPAYPSSPCPYNDNYYATCVDDKPRACKQAGYSETSCPDGQIVDASCPYDATYKKCKENPCSGYSTCPCGGASGASVCYSGTTQKFNKCQACCNEACPAGTTESNPGGCGGSTQNGCKTKTCFYSYQSCCDNTYPAEWGNSGWCTSDNAIRIENAKSYGSTKVETFTNGCGIRFERWEYGKAICTVSETTNAEVSSQRCTVLAKATCQCEQIAGGHVGGPYPLYEGINIIHDFYKYGIYGNCSPSRSECSNKCNELKNAITPGTKFDTGYCDLSYGPLLQQTVWK